METEYQSDQDSGRREFWKNFSEVSRLLVVQLLECTGSNFDIYLLANWEPVQVNQDWCDITITRSMSNNTSNGVLNKLKAGQIQCRRASKEGIAVVEA